MTNTASSLETDPRSYLSGMIDAIEASSVYSSAEESTVFPDGKHWARCTHWAEQIVDIIGADKVAIFGYQISDNPTAFAGSNVFGHDFAVVEGRWIADGWIKYVGDHGDRTGVYDMEDPKDAVVIAELYGDRDRWSMTSEPQARFGM